MNKSHILSGIRWTLITSVIRRLITLILFYFIARWLSRDDLGIFREYCLILGLVSVISTLSLDFHYIIEQKKTGTGLLALWQITIVSSLLGFILLTLASGLIGILYQSGVLGSLFRYASIFIIIESVRRTVRAMAARKQQFRQLALAETYNVVFYAVLSLVALYFYRSVKVYLIIFYLGNTLETVYLWKLNSATIKKVLTALYARKRVLCLTLNRFRRFLSRATLVSVVNQFSGNAPILILGMMIQPLYMGLYFFAAQLIGVPVGMFNTAVNQVFFPVFAGKKDGDIAGMASRYLRLVGNLGLPLLLLFSFVMMYAVGWLLGDKWADAIPLLPLMFLIFGSSFYSNPIGGIPFIKRKPGWELSWNVIALALKAGVMLWGLQTSFYTAIWAYATATAVMNICFYLMSMHLLRIRFVKTLRSIIVSFFPALIYAWLLLTVSRLPAMYAVFASVLLCGLILVGIDVLSKGMLRMDIRAITRID